MPGSPNLRDERLARTLDREIAPVWHERFARLLWRNLPSLERGMVLDVHSGVGNTLEQLLTRLPQAVRVVGLEPSPAKRALARSKLTSEWKNRVYLKAEDATAIAQMGDALYDLVVANLVLSEAHDLAQAIEGLMRVTKRGGTLLATLQMHGTWSEAEDLLREVLRDDGLAAAQQRIRRLANLRPTGPGLAATLRSLGLSRDHFVVEQERFSLLFGSGREFLFSPLVEQGPLRLWKAVVEGEGDPQQTFFRFNEAVDAYCAGSLFEVTAIAGAVVLRRPAPNEARRDLPGTRFWARFPELDALWAAAETTPPASRVDPLAAEVGSDPPLQPEVTREDEAILAMLDQDVESDEPELEALLDKVLEFGPRLEATDVVRPPPPGRPSKKS